jgi:hypothetical protein
MKKHTLKKRKKKKKKNGKFSVLGGLFTKGQPNSQAMHKRPMRSMMQQLLLTMNTMSLQQRDLQQSLFLEVRDCWLCRSQSAHICKRFKSLILEIVSNFETRDLEISTVNSIKIKSINWSFRHHLFHRRLRLSRSLAVMQRLPCALSPRTE